MKIIVTGAAGQLGSDIIARLNVLGIEAIAADINEFDITDFNAVSAFFKKANPDAVIHCAAYTAVDKAETDREACSSVNVIGTRNIAIASEECKAKCLFISTDYVFGGEGDKPFEVNDEKNPLNHYGATKLEGEKEVLSRCTRSFIVRTSWVFGLNGRNFVRSMLWLGSRKSDINVVCDQTGSPTFTQDLAVLVCEMIQTEKYGIYHATNEGFCTWAQFAEEIMKKADKNCRIIPITSEEYPCDAVRPHNSRLSKASLDAAGFNRLPDWQNALERYLKDYTE